MIDILRKIQEALRCALIQRATIAGCFMARGFFGGAHCNFIDIFFGRVNI